jgi:hypothetical protein
MYLYSFSISQGVGTRFKRETPPSSYWTKSSDGEVELVWSSDPNSKTKYHPNDGTVPLFSALELAPTYHDGGINRILGCPHYARSCKFCFTVTSVQSSMFVTHLSYYLSTRTITQANCAIQHQESSTHVVFAASKVVKWQHKTRTLHWIDTKSKKFCA